MTTAPAPRTVAVTEATLRRLRDCVEEGSDYYRTPHDLNQAQNILEELIDQLPTDGDHAHA